MLSKKDIAMTRNWWRAGGWGVLLTAMLVAGCEPTTDPAGQRLLAEGRRLFDGHNYGQAEGVFSEFLLEYDNTTSGAEAFYMRGLCRRRMQPADDAGATADFKQAAARGRHAALRSLARVALGHTYFEKNSGSDYRKSIQHYSDALREMADGPPKDAALFRLGVSLQSVGQWSEADGHLSKCMNGFPDSSFTPGARRRFGARTFRLQVEAFADLNRALARQGALRRSGWAADWTSIKRDGRVLYAVRSGQYDTFEQAKLGLRKLKATEPGAIIVAAELPRFGP